MFNYACSNLRTVSAWYRPHVYLLYHHASLHVRILQEGLNGGSTCRLSVKILLLCRLSVKIFDLCR